jgi:hypothetical protein
LFDSLAVRARQRERQLFGRVARGPSRGGGDPRSLIDGLLAAESNPET